MKRMIALFFAVCASCAFGQGEPLKDKTLVVWAAPANLAQKGGSALTIDDNRTHFDGIVFGERHAARWMPGSDGFLRTQLEQASYPAETADAKTFVQMAIVYRGKQITVYRDGKPYVQYDVAQPQEFPKDSVVVMGLRHLLSGDHACFAGAIDDARIYPLALSAEQIAALKPNQPSEPKPLAWWNFENGKPEELMGAYPPAKLVGNARIEGGRLILDGNGSSMVTPPSAAPMAPPEYVVPYASPIHFRPEQGVFADPIPFFWKGEYHVFYLRGGVGKVPWEHIVSKDLVHWKELPTVLVSDGVADGPDGEHMFTGSVTEKDGTFHIFYTGWNPRNVGGREFIMHATSPDLIAWTKHPEEQIGPDGVIYRNHQDRDWRDAFVFWNPEEQQHWMVLCSNSSKPDDGGVGLLTSKDLKTWKHEAPIKADQQECPDLFKIGDTWYLIGGDHYSFAKNPHGPFLKPPVSNVIDRPGVYAGKRMFDGKRHVWVGWVWDIPTGRDGEPGAWGGTQSLPRELYAGPEGQLYCKPVDEVVDAFKKTVFKCKDVDVGAASAFDEPDNYMVECEVQLQPGAELTVALRQQSKDGGYLFVIDPAKKEASLRGPGFDYRRPCPVDLSKPIKFQAFVQGTIIECFVNDQYALTSRAYNFRKGKLAFETKGGGAAKILRLAVKQTGAERQTLAWPKLPPNPQRPVYHFTSPDGQNSIPFDPNGAVFFKGRYHLGYIYQDSGRHFWGHVSSTDLLHWELHPPMLYTKSGEPENGIFSGNAFVDKKGRVALHYHGCGAGNCIAFNEDDDLNSFKKLPNNPVMKNPGWDPHGWLEGDTYYSISGGNPPVLYKALNDDQTEWKLVGNLLSNNMPGVDDDEDVSCPDLFKLGDKHILLCISHKRGARYYVGRFENEQFHPEGHFRMNWDSGACFAPETLLDDKGRRIMWAWALGGNLRGDPASMTLPRVLSLDKDGVMRIEPIKEIDSLRTNHQKHKKMDIPAGGDVAVDGIAGDCLEFQTTIVPPATGQCGVKVRCSPDGREQTAIVYDVARQKLRIELDKSTLDANVKYWAYVTTCAMRPGAENPEVKFQEAPLALKPGEPLKLRIYLDKSMLEVFANGRQCMTQRIWPVQKNSTGIRLFSTAAGAQATQLEAWDIQSPNPVALAEASLAEKEAGFQSLFDGKTLNGWKAADMSYWSVEDGAITAKITPDHPLKSNLYLIWQGGELADFELKMKHRVFGSPGINCGFQFRSLELPDHDVKGYQMDNNLNTDWLVRLYDEHGRETLAFRGERTVFDESGKATKSPIVAAQGPAAFRLEEWHEIDLTCIGPKLVLKINGKLAAEVLDNDPKQRDLQGILGLQLHTGPATVAQFKDIRLKVLKPASR